jgi:alpha-mannosidase
MDPIDECSVLLPSATLEDFPVGGTESDARSLLAAWTVLWHPTLLSRTGQIPTWYRADSPPTPDGPRVIVVPDSSLSQIPSDFRRKCDANPDCLWVTGDDRSEMLSALKLDPADPTTLPLEYSGRPLGVEDFFAAGYLSLQIQIMTRRLRYTSNLDELHLQGRITEAAKAFLARDAASTAEGLHDVFDALSEERDHYFSSDPHLIDLTLLTPSVLDSAIDSGWIDRMRREATEEDQGNGVLGTPRNVLVDGDVAAAICEAKNDAARKTRFDGFRELVSQDTVGWAGGGSALAGNEQPIERPEGTSAKCLDAMTMSSAHRAFQSGTALAEQAIGVAPSVYARLSGPTPVDLVPALSALGYKGVIPIDFAAGSGFGEESKVIVSGGGAEIEALTAKPIDAASDIAFLSIGAQLGESIDTGEVATALMVHWPDRICDSFRDLCRAATWSVALGRFWTLDRYFTDGERPYHNATLDAISKDSAAAVAQELVRPQSGVTLGSMADDFCESVRRETQRTTWAIAALAAPRLLEQSPSDRLAIFEAIGVTPKPENEIASDALCFNPHGTPVRRRTSLRSGAPADEKFIYAASDAGKGICSVTFDVPATGFTRLSASRPVKKTGLLKRLTGGKKGIAEASVLRNEFMAVSVDESTGGISGVFSASRGNRLSMRMVAANELSGESEGGKMVCQKIEMIESDLASGAIQTRGQLLNSDHEPLAQFRLRYRLERGSRRLEIDGSLQLHETATVTKDASLWKNYFAIRTAVAGEASIVRSLVRDKVHTRSTKRLVAPLGVLIDEAEKQTLLAGYGLPLHQKAGDRFLDTLVALPRRSAETPPADPAEIDFRFAYVFDCSDPVAVARSCISPPITIPIEPTAGSGKSGGGSTEQAWLIHVSPADVMITEMSTQRRSDGMLATRLQLVQTRPKTSKVRIQFCAFAHAAFVADRSGIDRSLEELPEDVTCDDGAVSLTLGSHEAIDLIVVFDI